MDGPLMEEKRIEEDMYMTEEKRIDEDMYMK